METIKFRVHPFSPRREGVKIYFFAHELRKKPIKFWTNIGNMPKHGRFEKIRQSLRDILEIKCSNGIDHLSYYAGSRVIFPVQITWHPNGNRNEVNRFWFEFSLWDPFGQKRILHFSRTCNQMDRFTIEEAKRMETAMCLHYHLMSSGYDFAKAISPNASTYIEVFAAFKETKEQLLTLKNLQNGKSKD